MLDNGELLLVKIDVVLKLPKSLEGNCMDNFYQKNPLKCKCSAKKEKNREPIFEKHTGVRSQIKNELRNTVIHREKPHSRDTLL